MCHWDKWLKWMSEGGQSTRMLQRNLFVTNALVNHSSETHVTGVYKIFLSIMKKLTALRPFFVKK